MNEIPQTVKMGKTIRYYREKEHWTQKELADRLDVTEKAVSSWENNTSTPRIGKLQKMAELFDVPITLLLTGNMDIIFDTAVKKMKKENQRRDLEKLRTNTETEQSESASKPPLDIIIENVNLINVEQLKRLRAYIDSLLAFRASFEKDVTK